MNTNKENVSALLFFTRAVTQRVLVSVLSTFHLLIFTKNYILPFVKFMNQFQNI